MQLERPRLKSTLTMSSVMIRVPKFMACCRISSISSGPLTPALWCGAIWPRTSDGKALSRYPSSRRGESRDSFRPRSSAQAAQRQRARQPVLLGDRPLEHQRLQLGPRRIDGRRPAAGPLPIITTFSDTRSPACASRLLAGRYASVLFLFWANYRIPRRPSTPARSCCKRAAPFGHQCWQEAGGEVSECRARVVQTLTRVGVRNSRVRNEARTAKRVVAPSEALSLGGRSQLLVDPNGLAAFERSGRARNFATPSTQHIKRRVNVLLGGDDVAHCAGRSCRRS